MKLTPHELQKVRSKGLVTRLTPNKKREDIVRDIDHMAKLILRRHGVNPKEYRINLENGDIVKRI